MKQILDKVNDLYKFCGKLKEELEGKNSVADDLKNVLEEREKYLDEVKENLEIRKKELTKIEGKTRKIKEISLVHQKEMEGKNTLATSLVGKAKEKEEKLASLEKSLIEREANIKKVEDIIVLSEDTKELAAKTGKDLQELETQRVAFSETMNRTVVEQSQKAKDLEDKEDKLNKEKKRIIDSENHLEALVTKEIKKILKK